MHGRARLLVAAAVLATLAASPPDPALAAGPAALTPTTPVLSLRRLPGFVATTVADRRLAAGLGEVMDDPRLSPARDESCISVRDPNGRVTFARSPDRELVPASTLKVVTATAALRRLGADFHYTTAVRAAAPPSGGAVAGDLWLVGAGDPLLATGDFAAVAGYHGLPRLSTPLEVLADRVVAAGVRTVSGRVVGDESRYDTQRYLPSWKPAYITDPEVGPQSALSVNEGFVQWRPKAVPAGAPAATAADVFTGLLRARGVTVGADAGEGRAPATGAPVATIDSPPLSAVLGVMLQESDNLAAELLVKELGARFGGSGTTAAGLEVMRSTLTSMGLPAAAVASVDGSGLDRSDRVSCDALQSVLAQGGEQGVVGQALPVAGRNGTLARRFGDAAAGRVRAKTGTLEGVAGLGGWATGQDGRAVQFALLANDLPPGAGTGLEDRVVGVLVAYPQAPAVADIGPTAPKPRPPGP